MPCTLDHEYYPHLFESIFRCAPVGALIKLRATCKAFQRLVDTILFAHVQLHAFPGAGDNWEQQVLGLTLPSDTELLCSGLPRLPWVPGAVVVLDDPGTFGEYDLSRSVSLSDFSALKTFRRLHRSDMERRGDHSSLLDGVDTAVEFASTLRWVRVSPPSCRRLVMHVRGDHNGHYNIYVAPCPTAREYVLVLWPPLRNGDLSDVIIYYFDIIFEAVNLHERTDDYESVTVVGFEDLFDLDRDGNSIAGPPFPGYTIRHPVQDAHIIHMSHKRRQCQCGEHNDELSDAFLAQMFNMDHIVDRFCDRLRFLTFGEWRAELGEARAEEAKWIEPRVEEIIAHT